LFCKNQKLRRAVADLQLIILIFLAHFSNFSKDIKRKINKFCSFAKK